MKTLAFIILLLLWLPVIVLGSACYVTIAMFRLGYDGTQQIDFFFSSVHNA